MQFIPSPAGRAAVNPGPTSTGLIANDSLTTVLFKTVQCQQDTVGTGYFEVFASLTGAGICLTNFIVIAAIVFGGPKMHKATFYCISNLAVADLLAGMLLLWIFGVQKVVLSLRTPETELVQKSVWTVTVWSSMLSQLVIAVDRYYCVTKSARGEGGSTRSTHLKQSKWGNSGRKKFIKIGIALTWLIPIITFVLPVVTIWNCAKDCVCQMPSNSSTGVYYMVCSPVESCSQINPPFTKGSMLFLGLTLILMPSIPCVLYAKIYHFARNSTRKLKPATFSVNSSDYQQLPTSRHPSNAASSVTSKPRAAGRGKSLESRDSRAGDNQSLKSGKRSWQSRALISRLLAKSEGSTPETRTRRPELVQSARKSSGSTVKANFVQRSQRRDMRLLRTLIIILGLLLVCTVPLGALFLISFHETDKRYVETTKVLLTSSLLNSLINPWIYFWRFPEMRKSIRKALCRCCPCDADTSRRIVTDSLPSADRRRPDGPKKLSTSVTRENSARPTGPTAFVRAESLADRERTSSSNSWV